MKPFRTTAVLLALLVLPLFASEALADFSATRITESFINPSTKVSANSDTLVMAFVIPATVSGETLTTVGVRSAIERSFATERVRLWVEDGTTPGWQRTEDDLLGFRITSSHPTGFETNDVITFTGLSYELTDGDTFYISLDMYNSYVTAQADSFHETGLEVVIDQGFIELKDGQVNTNDVRNGGWNPGPPAFYDPFILLFDTKGPQFDLHFCIEENTCSTYTYYGGGTPRLLNVDHLDSVRICAKNIDPDIMGDITVIGWVHLTGYVSSMHMFGVPSIKLTASDTEPDGCSGWCLDSYNTIFQIPDINTGSYPGVDADSGHWMVCAFAQDTAGNRDTICIGHDDLQFRIDTQDPIIDSVTWKHVYDWNGDGMMGLGDSIMIIGWGLSNAWEPQFECAKMFVDWVWYTGTPDPDGHDWVELDDVLEHNRVFRKTFGLTDPVPIDSTDCPVSFLVQAWDNACNEDTLRAEICGTMDLDPPSVSVVYEWDTDYDTSFACIGIGDKVFIEATVGGNDIVSVVAWMDSAGIDELMQHNMPLPYRGGDVYDTIWTVTEPPIQYGKDADNSDASTNWPPGPPTDDVYRVWVVACDDVGNCDTAWGELNKTLDTRIPRAIGYFCPDSVPCALHAEAQAGGIIEITWDTACDENDAFYYYVWASFEGAPFESIGATNVTEQSPTSKYFSWHSEPLAEGYWEFKIKTEDNCSNVGPFSCVVGAYADATPPHVCIAVPDSGLTFGDWFPLKAVADSESHDADSACLWYRLRPDIDNPLLDPGGWIQCLSNPCMYHPDDGIVFLDSVYCLQGVDYIGWVEMIVLACDKTGNCQDTIMALDDACLVDNDVFRPGHFLFYWDTLAPAVHLISVNGFPSQQSACGFDVDPDTMNEIVIDVDGATAADSFEVDVRALCSSSGCRIFHQDFVTMPCTIWVSVDGWPEGTQYLYINVKDYDNDKDSWVIVDLCVPPLPPENCIYISSPREWTRIPCTGTSGYNRVRIKAKMYDYYQCQSVLFTEVRFQWSPDAINWFTIEDVIGSGPWWTTWWDNTGLVQDGDTVYFRAIAHDEFYMADTSYMVKVFVDCTQPQVSLRIEDLYYTCGNDIPKVPCDELTLKAVLQDTLVDLDDVVFFVKRHSEPDIWEAWQRINDGDPAWSDNIWMYLWKHPCCEDQQEGAPSGGGPQQRACMWPNDYWDIRIAAKDISGNYMFDYDEDGRFDDSTFNDAMAAGAGLTIFVDDEAPEPAISSVRDEATGITIINPSDLLGGTDEAYVQAGNDITAQVSILPSEDTCEVMKVEWFLQIRSHDHLGGHHWGDYVHVGTSYSPHHYPVTFNPLTQGLIPPEHLEDGHWVGRLKAELYDSLGNSEDDKIDLYILDVTPTQAVIIQPLNDTYVWGDVTLKVAAINDYEICKVCYEYRPAECPFDQDTCWKPVNGGYPNACVEKEYHGHGGADRDHHDHFELDWHTLNTVPDGEYYLRAIATDCDNNVDDDPATIRVTVVNGLPEVTMLDPSFCFRECPDDTLDTLGFVGGKVLVEATVVPGAAPITYVEFFYKNIFDPPSGHHHEGYDLLGSDEWPTNGVYDALWNTKHGPDDVRDGRYHLKARAYNAAGRYADSDPIVVSVDNTDPLVEIVSMNGQTHLRHLDISLYDTLAIQVVAWDTLSRAGGTRCYNTGVTDLGFCVTDGVLQDDGDWPLSQMNWYTDYHDGDTLIYWNVTGLEPGEYYVYVLAKDCIGNWEMDWVEVRVYDQTPPMVTIGGFYYNECHKIDYIYGYTCDEDLLQAKLEYRKIVDGDTSAWLGVGEPDFYDEISGQRTKGCDDSWSCDHGPCCCPRRIIQWRWDASASLEEGDGINYQARILATDCRGNNSEDYAETHAPIVNFQYENGAIVPEPGPLSSMSFEKNFKIDNMQGIVKQYSWDGDEPQMFGLYVPEDDCGNSLLECIWMQQNLNQSSYFAGSFKAKEIEDGGVAAFFSSVTVFEDQEFPATGEGQAYTYLRSAEFMTVKVDKDLGTFDTYCTTFEPKWNEVCVSVPGGALSGRCDKYIVVWPETMPPISLFQPTWIPVGDEEGYATYVGFTEDCDHECRGGDGGGSGGSSSDGDYCCFHNGRYATIKMNYSSELDVPAESLFVAWWDNHCGKWKTDGLHWGAPFSEGFNTDEHYVEFVAECLHGPFAVIYLQERECEGTIVVNFMDMEPYCNGYTGPMPRFRTLITDNIHGTDGIVESSMKFKIKKPGEPYITIYDRSAGYDSCDWWAKGYGQYDCAGWDPVTGILGTGWNDTTFFYRFWYSDDPFGLCQGCYFHHYANNQNYYNCGPAPGLAEGDSFFAQVTAENENNHSCTQTLQFSVDATKPRMWFADSVGAYVGKNPHFCMYFTDDKAGMDKSSIWLDVYALESSNPSPSYHNPVATITPDMLHWMDDTTVCVDLTFEFNQGGYLHIFVYGGDECMCDTCVYPQWYFYRCGVADCVGNRLNTFWQYFTVDAYGPDITFRGADWCDLPLKFEITDALSGLQYVEVFEDSTLVDLIERDPHNPRYWYYSPSEGPHHVDLRAVDNLGNENVYSFDLTADCVPPVLTFIPGYIDCEDFTISFVLTDAVSGVDWDAVNLDLYYNSNYILSFTPEDIATMKSGDTVTVTVTGDEAAYLQLYNNAMLYAVVYSAKNYGTNYTAGPVDLAGNYYSSYSYYRQAYYADCAGPSISWKNTGYPKECDWPVLLSVTDAKSGVDEVKVYEDGVEQPATSLIYNPATELWEYSPTTGMHTLDVVATDMVGNQTTYTFDVRDDCVGPVVSFADGYVTKNPTLEFSVTDQGSGVDWTTVNAWVTGCGEECTYLSPWIIENREGSNVTLDGCNLDCNDGNEVVLYVYSGTYRTSAGPADLAGNYAPSYYMCSFVVDAYGPVFSPSCGSINKSLRPITIGITDARSGIDWCTLEFFEDSLLLCEGLECEDTTVAIDTVKGTIEYMPPAGMRYVEIYIRDYAGNLSTCSFYTEEEELSFRNPYNYPNPFDPRETRTTIMTQTTKSAYVTVKIFDFAGEHVTTLWKDKWVGTYTALYWDGRTEDGTEVADGTYLCHIKARDNNGSVKTAVIKITVLKKD